MATEQEVREENKNLHAQVNSLVADIQKEREDKQIAKKKLYQTLEKYEKTLRFFRNYANATYELKEKRARAIYKEYKEKLEVRDPELLELLKAQFPDDYGTVEEDILVQRLLAMIFQEQMTFSGFLLMCKLFFDKALDPNTLPDEMSNEGLHQLVAKLSDESPEQFDKDFEKFWGKPLVNKE